MKHVFLLALTLCVAITSIQAQQQLRRSQFVTNTYLANPAVAGTESGTMLSSTYRQQWAGFSGGPATMLLSGHRALPNGLGAGFVLYNDDMGGAFSQSGVELTGAYSVLLNNQDAVSFGLSMKGNQFVFDGTELEVYQQGDEALPQTRESTFGLDFNAGVMVYGQDYYFGMAVFNLIEDRLNISGVQDDLNRLVRHYHFMGSYLYDLDNLWAVQSSVLLRMTEATAPQLDLNIRGILNGTYCRLGIQTRIHCGQFGNELCEFICLQPVSTATNLLVLFMVSVGYCIPAALASGVVRAEEEGPEQ